MLYSNEYLEKTNLPEKTRSAPSERLNEERWYELDAISILVGILIGVFLGIIAGLYIWRGIIGDRIGNLANQALKNNNEQFLTLANENLKGTVDPLKKQLDDYSNAVNEIEKSRNLAYGSLQVQIKNLAGSQKELETVTNTLSTALRNPQVRGRWGEITLQRLVELAGMVEYCDFDTQVTSTDQDSTIRPDMIVNLPSTRQLIVDSKIPLNSYLESLEAENDEKRNDLISRHAKAIRDHLKELSSKAYWQHFPSSPEFVIMFIPGEAFLYAALQVDKDLIEDGMKNNIIISTPTTLISLLKAVARGWSEKKMEENAQRISNLGKDLFERLSKMNESISDLGKKIDNSVKSYNKLVGTFEGRVLVSARKFNELGVGTADEIQSPEDIDALTREPRKEEEG